MPTDTLDLSTLSRPALEERVLHLSRANEKHIRRWNEVKPLLKKSVADNAALESTVQERESVIRRLNNEMDTLTFSKQALESKVKKLQTAFKKEQQEHHMLKAQANTTLLSQLLLPAADTKSKKEIQLETSLRAYEQELRIKIEENERIHMTMFELKIEQEETLGVMKKKVTELQSLADERAERNRLLERDNQQLESTLESARKQHDEKTEEWSATLNDLSQRLTDETQRFHSLEQQLTSQLNEAHALFRSKVLFDDSQHRTLNSGNVARFNHAEVVATAAFVDELGSFAHSLRNEIVGACKNWRLLLDVPEPPLLGSQQLPPPSEQDRATLRQAVTGISNLTQQLEQLFDQLGQAMTSIRKHLTAQAKGNSHSSDETERHINIISELVASILRSIDDALLWQIDQLERRMSGSSSSSRSRVRPNQPLLLSLQALLTCYRHLQSHVHAGTEAIQRLQHTSSTNNTSTSLTCPPSWPFTYVLQQLSAPNTTTFSSSFAPSSSHLPTTATSSSSPAAGSSSSLFTYLQGFESLLSDLVNSFVRFATTEQNLYHHEAAARVQNKVLSHLTNVTKLVSAGTALLTKHARAGQQQLQQQQQQRLLLSHSTSIAASSSSPSPTALVSPSPSDLSFSQLSAVHGRSVSYLHSLNSQPAPVHIPYIVAVQTADRLKVVEAECARLRDDMRTVLTNVTNLETERAQHLDTIETLNKELDQVRTAFDRAQAELSTSTSSYNTLERQHDTLRNEFELTEERLMKLESKLSEWKEKVKSLEKDKQAVAEKWKEEGASWSAKLDKVKQQLDSAEQARKLLQAQHEAQTDEVATLRKQQAEVAELASNVSAADTDPTPLVPASASAQIAQSLSTSTVEHMDVPSDNMNVSAPTDNGSSSKVSPPAPALEAACQAGESTIPSIDVPAVLVYENGMHAGLFSAFNSSSTVASSAHELSPRQEQRKAAAELVDAETNTEPEPSPTPSATTPTVSTRMSEEKSSAPIPSSEPDVKVGVEPALSSIGAVAVLPPSLHPVRAPSSVTSALAEYARLANELARSDAKAVRYHSQLSKLANVANAAHARYLDAQAEVAKCRAQVKKLTEDQGVTKANYEVMMAELTEHICQLTEKLASTDAQQQQRNKPKQPTKSTGGTQW